MKNIYPTVPGRGLVTASGVAQRLEYLAEQDLPLSEIPETRLLTEQLRNNIESLVGSTEIPLGLVGPLLYNNGEQGELVYAVVGTLEGALVASMNRGAKAVSMGGGFSAHMLHQKMIRAPMFTFRNLAESVLFKGWVEKNRAEIGMIAERGSNHAKLIELVTVVVGKSVHVKFVYTTGDATGQNMSTSCTWNATLWMEKTFEEEMGIEIVSCVVEGNGASDKKVSGFSMSHGRGVHVVAECHIPERVVNLVLRTSSSEVVQSFNASLAITQLDGMVGYNVNVANAIAAIFVATGQDLGSLHESCCGIFNVEKTDDGIYLAVNLPTLVIGTVGGGTHLPCQREALELMGCYGSGKLPRFASLIAGFTLALEISTYAAVVSGQFAKAHEKLGRNRPVQWLLKSEIDKKFVEASLNGSFSGREIRSVELLKWDILDNGILTNLTSRISRKLMGFVPISVVYLAKDDPNSIPVTLPLLLKIKPLDREVIEGLHLMATAVNPELADLVFEHRESLEYTDCHVKEMVLYTLFHNEGIPYIPDFYGTRIDENREIHLFIQEFLDKDHLSHFNSENQPELWDTKTTKDVIRAITEIHKFLSPPLIRQEHPCFRPFFPWDARPLYSKMIFLSAEYHHEMITPELEAMLYGFFDEMEREYAHLGIPQTIIHNDFNPRNIAVRSNGLPCIYDWELSVINIPHRDLVEFLSFSMEEDFNEELFEEYLDFHYELYADDPERPDQKRWNNGYRYAIMEYLVARVPFYLVGDIVASFEFAQRIFKNCFRMLEVVEDRARTMKGDG